MLKLVPIQQQQYYPMQPQPMQTPHWYNGPQIAQPVPQYPPPMEYQPVYAVPTTNQYEWQTYEPHYHSAKEFKKTKQADWDTPTTYRTAQQTAQQSEAEEGKSPV